MSVSWVYRIETGVERIAAALFGGAAAFCVSALLQGAIAKEAIGVVALAAGAGAYLLSSWVLRAGPWSRRSFLLPAFELAGLEFNERGADAGDQPQLEELVLSDSDRLPPVTATEPPEPLLLDDVLDEIGPDARVVRLFERTAMPTPGQLQSRIDRHLGRGSSAQADAAQALSEALAELRRTLR